MKTLLQKKIFIFASLVLLLIPINAIGEDNTTISPIKIDRHWIYIYQQDDFKTFEINEYFYINNTGETTFNDSFFIWIQNNSIIGADCCNYNPNEACRYNEIGSGECFYLNKTEDNNLFVGYPFLNGNKLSYYGQRETFSINAFSTKNSSLKSSTLHLNATIGVPSRSREQENFQGIGVHLTSENLDVGMLPVIDPHMPFNITTIENITLFNNGTTTEVIDFNISNLSEGWNVEIWDYTGLINNVSLSPQEYVNLTLMIRAPSYLASIYVRYTTQIGIDGDESRGSFIKKYHYDTKKVTYEVYLLNKDDLEVSDELIMVHDELYWLEEYERYWFYAKIDDVSSNSYTMIKMKLINTTGDESNIYTILILILIVIFIITIALLKKIDFFKGKNAIQKKDISPEKSKLKLIKENKEKRIKELEEQKKEVLSSIKRVEREFKDEILSKKDYERFRTAYKNRAVEILKEIDRLNE